jgi:hypothetical protein
VKALFPASALANKKKTSQELSEPFLRRGLQEMNILRIKFRSCKGDFNWIITLPKIQI